jgi:hypothetical protein
MKTLLVATLIVIPSLALADSATNSPAPAATPNPALAGLTPDQQKLADQFLAAEEKKKKAIDENKALTPQQKMLAITNVEHETLVQIEELKLSTPAPAKHP